MPFSGHTPGPQCLSCNEGPKTEHSARGAASPVLSTEGRSPPCSCSPAGCTIADTSQDALGLLGHMHLHIRTRNISHCWICVVSQLLCPNVVSIWPDTSVVGQIPERLHEGWEEVCCSREEAVNHGYSKLRMYLAVWHPVPQKHLQVMIFLVTIWKLGSERVFILQRKCCTSFPKCSHVLWGVLFPDPISASLTMFFEHWLCHLLTKINRWESCHLVKGDGRSFSAHHEWVYRRTAVMQGFWLAASWICQQCPLGPRGSTVSWDALGPRGCPLCSALCSLTSGTGCGFGPTV